MEVAGNDWIEARASGNQVTHAGAEGRVDFSEEQLAGVQAKLAHEAVHAHQVAQHRLGNSPALGDFFAIHSIVAT